MKYTFKHAMQRGEIKWEREPEEYSHASIVNIVTMIKGQKFEELSTRERVALFQPIPVWVEQFREFDRFPKLLKAFEMLDIPFSALPLNTQKAFQFCGAEWNKHNHFNGLHNSAATWKP